MKEAVLCVQYDYTFAAFAQMCQRYASGGISIRPVMTIFLRQRPVNPGLAE